MRLKRVQLQLKTILSSMVFCLSLLTLVAVAAGWYSQQQSQHQLDALLATSVVANNNVKMSYIAALQTVSMIDDAVKLTDKTQRSAALDKAQTALSASKNQLNSFLNAKTALGTQGKTIKKDLNDAFTFYWTMASSLKKWALTGNKNIYAAVKNGQIAMASSVIEGAFNQFDQFVKKQNQQAAAAFDAFSRRAQYVYAALVTLAIILALAAYLTLSRTVLRPLKKVDDYFTHIAGGDLTLRIDTSSKNEIGTLYAAVKRMQDSLAHIVGSVRAGMDQLSSGSQHIVDGNTDLSARTEEQAAALQQTAASMEQLASTVKQNADNAKQANQLASTASDVARKGGQAVTEVVATMQAISGSSHKIADIVGVIDSIAFQTNILALNAAVEAARAGEQGKGFAVVASEVRALAQRSAQAAKEIKGLIEDSVNKVTEGSGQVERAGATMQEIVASVARVTDIMAEISAATTEQSSGIEEINRAVAQMDDVTQQNAVLVDRAAESAAELGKRISQVTHAVSVFKVLDNQIIDIPVDDATGTINNSTDNSTDSEAGRAAKVVSGANLIQDSGVLHEPEPGPKQQPEYRSEHEPASKPDGAQRHEQASQAEKRATRAAPQAPQAPQAPKAEKRTTRATPQVPKAVNRTTPAAPQETEKTYMTRKPVAAGTVDENDWVEF